MRKHRKWIIPVAIFLWLTTGYVLNGIFEYAMISRFYVYGILDRESIFRPSNSPQPAVAVIISGLFLTPTVLGSIKGLTGPDGQTHWGFLWWPDWLVGRWNPPLIKQNLKKVG